MFFVLDSPYIRRRVNFRLYKNFLNGFFAGEFLENLSR